MNNASTIRVSRSNHTRLLLLAALAPLVTPLAADAANKYWKIGSGNWNVAANWSNASNLSTAGSVPVAGDAANIWNNDATSRIITLNANGAATSLDLANFGTGTNRFAQGNFNFTTNTLYVGSGMTGAASRGAYTQTGGTNTVNAGLVLARFAGSVGSYTMTGGTLNLTAATNPAAFYIGQTGAGTFTQSGTSNVTIGTSSRPIESKFGITAGSNGTYNLNGGSFTANGRVDLGAFGAGVFNQTGGTATINGPLDLAVTATGSSGTVTVGPGAAFNVNGNTVLGGSNTGPSGTASMTVKGNATLKDVFLNLTGTLNLEAGGTLSVSSLHQFRGTNRMNWTGGTLNVPSVSISNSSTSNDYFGPFLGNSTVNANIALNTQYFGVGDVGGFSATFAQNAGTVTVGTPTTNGSLLIGIYQQSGGHYTLNNTGKLDVYGDVTVGGGSLNVNGGAMTVSKNVTSTDQGDVNIGGGSLSVGARYTSNAKLQQTGGSLSVAGELILQNGGMEQTGGTATIGTSLNAPVGIVAVTGAGTTLTVNGNTNLGSGNSGALLNVGAGATVNANGRVNQTLNSVATIAGTFSANVLSTEGRVTQTGGAVTVTGATMLAGSLYEKSGGTATLGTLNLYSGGRLSLSGTGQLTATGLVEVGNSTTSASIAISGGNMTANAGVRSLYHSSPITISGGKLTTPSLNSYGPVTQTGGTLDLGSFSNNSGTFTLSGGTAKIEDDLNVFGNVLVSGGAGLQINGGLYLGGSGGGSGVFNQSGGIVNIAGETRVFSGSLNLSRGSFISPDLRLGGGARFNQTGADFYATNIDAANAFDFKFDAGTILLKGNLAARLSGLTVGDGTQAASLYLMNGSVSNGRVTVAPGSSLFGNGTISSGLTVNGNLLPGDGASFGRLTLRGTTTLNPSARTTFEVLPTDSDVITAEAITLGGTLDILTSPDFMPAFYASKRIISATSVTGQFSKVINANASVRALAITYDSTGVLLTAALAGDTNLDRAVNFDDLLKLAQNYGQTTGQTWSTGDLNGTGSVDFDDLLGLAQNYGQSAAMISALSPEFAADWALARSLTPEPGALLALVAAAPTMIRRRRQGDLTAQPLSCVR